MKIEEKISKYLNESRINEAREKFAIEVSVKDAKKAEQILRDDPNARYKQTDSNYFVFPNKREFEDALAKLEDAKIELYDVKGE
jgi:hypothetical protein